MLLTGNLTLHDPQSTQERKYSRPIPPWIPLTDSNVPQKKTKDPRGSFPEYNAKTEALSTARLCQYALLL
jgi:hypothetical protein